MLLRSRLSFLLVFTFLLGLLVSSCSSSNDVATYGLIQKRKHRKGFHMNIGKSRVSDAIAVGVTRRQEPFVKPVATEEEVRQIAASPSQKDSIARPASARILLLRNVVGRVQSSKAFKRIHPLLFSKQDFHKKQPVPEWDEEEESSDLQRYARIAFVAGIAAWILSLLGVLAILVVGWLSPFLFAAALIAAVVAAVFGNRSKHEETLGFIGWLLGLVYLALVAITFALTVLAILVFIIAFLFVLDF